MSWLEPQPAFGGGQRFQSLPPDEKCLATEVDTRAFEEIVGEEGDRKLVDVAAGGSLAMEPFRELIEAELAAPTNNEQLAIEDGALGEALRRGDHLGKPLADELLAARPERRLSAAAYELRSRAIPLPFHLPARHIAEHGRRLVERRGEKEWVGAARRGGGSRIEKLTIILCRLESRGDEALEDLRRLDASHDSQRPGYERPRHAEAEAAGEKLVPHDSLRRAEAAPHLFHHRPLPSLVGLGADPIHRAP